MGNAIMGTTGTTIEDKIKIIATQYILTQDYESMRNMATNTSYCNQIQQLANTLIKQNMTPEEIARFAEQVRQQLPQQQQQQRFTGEAQKQDCLALANYFTLLAHLFSAIMTTVNPMFYYTNEQGKMQKSTLYNKQNLPNNAKYVVEGSFCTRRIDGLTNDNFTKSTATDPTVNSTDNIILTPQLLCNQLEEEQKDPRNFNTEIGLADLDKLYFSDQDNNNNNNGYNNNNYYNNNRNTNNSTPEQRADVLKLYTAITGETVLPNNIQKFADLDFSRSSNLDVWRKDICVNKVDKSTMFSVDNDDDAMKSQDTDTQNLFVSYGKHIKDMLMFNSNQKEILLKIIDQLFDITKSSSILPPTNTGNNLNNNNNTAVPPKKETFKETVTIKTNVTLTKLKELIALARKTILNLYITCERSFLAGLGIYESIIEQKILNKQLNDDEFDMIIADIMLKSYQGSSSTTSSTSLTSATALAAAAAQAALPPLAKDEFVHEEDEFGDNNELVDPTPPKIIMQPPVKPIKSILKPTTTITSPTISKTPLVTNPVPVTHLTVKPVTPLPTVPTVITPIVAPVTPLPTIPIVTTPIVAPVTPLPTVPTVITPIVAPVTPLPTVPALTTPIVAPVTPLPTVPTVTIPPALTTSTVLTPATKKDCNTITDSTMCNDRIHQKQNNIQGPCKFNETTNTCEKASVSFAPATEVIPPK